MVVVEGREREKNVRRTIQKLIFITSVSTEQSWERRKISVLESEGKKRDMKYTYMHIQMWK